MSISAILSQKMCCIKDFGYIFLVFIGLKDPHIFQLPNEPLKVLRMTCIRLWFRRACLASPFLVSDQNIFFFLSRISLHTALCYSRASRNQPKSQQDRLTNSRSGDTGKVDRRQDPQLIGIAGGCQWYGIYCLPECLALSPRWRN